jgi:hypothetical protein
MLGGLELDVKLSRERGQRHCAQAMRRTQTMRRTQAMRRARSLQRGHFY